MMGSSVVVVAIGQYRYKRLKLNDFQPPPLTEMKELDPLENRDLKRLQLFVYLIPVIGFFPIPMDTVLPSGTREQQAVSRLSVTLAFSWLLGYILLSTGGQISEFWTLRLLIMNTMLTSGYFVVSVA
jgi:hypothetical protein